LAAISLRGYEDPAGFIGSFTGSHRFVLDYLVEQILKQQPAEIQSFLLQTSVLERLCGSLCDSVVETRELRLETGHARLCRQTAGRI
jgi:LuxR family maltose regulon positive regulatory protein